uniref:Uncharacterized protein n=1 Tax=Parascaris equorum TaxID=6256 RepID=A0A914SDU3_PAREQ
MPIIDVDAELEYQFHVFLMAISVISDLFIHKERTRNQFSTSRWHHYLLLRNVFRQTSHVRCGERTDRTTHMLLAIVFVFLVAELPQGVMAVLSGMFSEEFRRHIYNNLGDILDLLSFLET